MVREQSASALMGLCEEQTNFEGFEANYELVGDGLLGEGTFGVVWRCRALRGNDRSIKAVKRVWKSRLKSRDIRNLFGQTGKEGEIKMHLRLKHPHIVELHEYFDDSQTVSLVMEYCAGGDLFDLIADQ